MLCILAAAVAFSTTKPFEPPVLSYLSLASGGSRAELAAALSGDGIVQIIGVPGYDSKVLELARECPRAFEQAHDFADGTRRESMASRTIPGPGGMQPFALPGSCEVLARALGPFRLAVDEATRVFSASVSSLLDVKMPLLSTPDGQHSFQSFADVVEAGEHLEHIHSYAREASASPPNDKTIDLHTDQGLFIAFTPALEAEASTFHVRRADGALARAVFRDGALVFMIGQGAEALVALKQRPQAAFSLRPTPHALSMVATATSAPARMWYGRMVLPPSGAQVSGAGGMTYGELREEMIAATERGAGAGDGTSLGCGHSSLEKKNKRMLAATSCDAGAIYCWHRCMELTPADSFFWSELHADANAAAAEWKDANNSTNSTAACAAQGLAFQCASPRDEMYNGLHGDFYPACTSTTTEWGSYPNDVPARDEGGCGTEAALLAAAAEDGGAYTAQAELRSDCDTGQCLQGLFQWRLDPAGVVHGRLTANGMLGWAGFGLANRDPAAAKNGMAGGHVTLLLPDAPASFSDRTGLSAPPLSPAVAEFVISEGPSAFRFWKDPYPTPSLRSAGWARTDCFTQLSFATRAMAGWELNTTGTDKMIWAFNDVDHFVGYHGRSQRGVVFINWKEGVPTAVSEEALSGINGSDDEEKGTALGGGYIIAIAAPSALAAALLLVVVYLVATRAKPTLQTEPPQDKHLPPQYA